MRAKNLAIGAAKLRGDTMYAKSRRGVNNARTRGNEARRREKAKEEKKQKAKTGINVCATRADWRFLFILPM